MVIYALYFILDFSWDTDRITQYWTIFSVNETQPAAGKSHSGGLSISFMNIILVTIEYSKVKQSASKTLLNMFVYAYVYIYIDSIFLDMLQQVNIFYTSCIYTYIIMCIYIHTCVLRMPGGQQLRHRSPFPMLNFLHMATDILSFRQNKSTNPQASSTSKLKSLRLKS